MLYKRKTCGADVRTAAAFGVDHIVISADCADIYNSKTVRAAMGALFRQSIIRVDNMVDFLIFFAFSTILGWYYFGEVNFRWLFGQKRLFLYPMLVILAIFTGSILKNDFIWELQDLCNQLMVFPNVLALTVLSGIVAQEARRKKE